MSQPCQIGEQLFVGDSEMATLIQARFAGAEGSADWPQTSLGPVATWSQSLRTSLSICLSSPSPILLWWGKDLVMFYNDAYRPILGAKHPQSMGQRGRDCWVEVWDVMGPMLEGVLLTGQATWLENQLLLLDRHGYIEECYFTFSYSPIADETGGIGGVFTAVTETTRQVIGERRLQTLRDLAATTAKAKTVEQAYQAAIATLAGNPHCIPFALLYRIESGNQAHLVASTGLKAGAAASPTVVSLSQGQAWPFEQVQITGQSQRIENLSTQFGEGCDSNGTTIAHDAILLPLTQAGDKQRVIGFLVLGISPKLAFDLDYQSFFDLVRGSVETAIAKVEAYEAEQQRDEALAKRDRASAALRQSEEQLRLATEAAHLGLWHWDVQSDKLTWTDQCKALFGLPPDTEMSYPVFLNAIHPDDRQRIQNMLPVLENGRLEHHEHEYRTRWPDGTVRWLMARGSATYGADGKPISSMGVIFDITERKQAEVALQVKSAELRHVTETAGIGLTRCNRDLRYLSVNPAYAQLAGLTVEEIVGKSIVEVVGESAFEVIRPYINRVLQGERVEYEVQVPFAAAGTRDLYVVCTPDEDSNGNINGWIASLIDISDRKRTEKELRRSEQQLRSAIEVARFSPYEWNPVTDELIWDAQLKAMWGLAPDAEVSLAVHNAGLHPEDRKYVEHQVAKAIDPNGKGIFEAEFRVIGIEDGIERWISARGQTFFDAERRPVYYVGAAQDVTHRKRTEEALRESEERLRLAMEAAQMGSWDLNLSTGELVWSEQYFKVLGYEPIAPREANYEVWSSRVHPEDLEWVLQKWQQSRLEHQVYRAEYRVIRADNGEIAWVASLGNFTYDETGQAIRALGVVFDITDRKQAEIALSESEYRFRRLMEVVPVGIWLAHDPDCRQVTVNRVAYNLMRAEPGDPTTATPESGRYPFKFKLQCNGQDIPPEELSLQKAGRTGQEVVQEAELVFEDGVVHYIYGRAVPLRNEVGIVRGVIGAYVDISDRKQIEAELRESEERYRYLVEAVPQHIWTADAQGRNTYASQKMYDYIGVPSAQAMSVDWRTILHPDDVERIYRRWTESLQTGMPYEAECRLRRADGVYRWHFARAIPFRDENGQIVQWFGVSIDIHDKQELEQQRLQLLQQAQAAREEAETANRIKDEFLAVLSHELRSPLNPILGWSRLLQNGNLDESKTKQALATIERCVFSKLRHLVA